MSQGITVVVTWTMGRNCRREWVGIASERRGNSGALQALPSEVGGAGSEGTRRVARQQPGFSRGDCWGCSWCFPQACRREQRFSAEPNCYLTGTCGAVYSTFLLLPSPARRHLLVPPVPTAPLSSSVTLSTWGFH